MKLVGPSDIGEQEFNEFVDEFKSVNEDLVPYSLNQKDRTFPDYVRSLNDESIGKGISDSWVPASTFFLIDDTSRIVGATNLRHRLTDGLRIDGGHIGYGVRPSSRSSGNGTTILELALEKARQLGLGRVLLTCDKDNAHSARTIEKNGGRFDSEEIKGDRLVQRYWIEL